MPNPNYDKNTSDMYSKNCQSCVVAYELRRRGYDVEALGRIIGDENNMPNKLAHHTELAWKDFEGKTPKSKNIGGKDKAIDDLKTEFAQHTKDIGRYHVKWEYAGKNYGHIVVCERFKKSLLIYDAQMGETLDLDSIINKIDKNKGLSILRVDNKLINADIINSIVKMK